MNCFYYKKPFVGVRIGKGNETPSVIRYRRMTEVALIYTYILAHQQKRVPIQTKCVSTIYNNQDMDIT